MPDGCNRLGIRTRSAISWAGGPVYEPSKSLPFAAVECFERRKFGLIRKSIFRDKRNWRGVLGDLQGQLVWSMEVPNVPGRPVGRRERVEEPLNRWIAMLIVYLGFSFVKFGIARELHRGLLLAAL